MERTPPTYCALGEKAGLRPASLLLPVGTGLALAVGALCLLFQIGEGDRRKVAEKEVSAAADRIAASLQTENKMLILAARSLAGSAAEIPSPSLSELRKIGHSLRPEYTISFYSAKGELIPVTAVTEDEAKAPTAESVAPLLQKGGLEGGCTENAGGKILFSAALPIKNGPARTLVASIPLEAPLYDAARNMPGESGFICRSSEMGGKGVWSNKMPAAKLVEASAYGKPSLFSAPGGGNAVFLKVSPGSPFPSATTVLGDAAVTVPVAPAPWGRDALLSLGIGVFGGLAAALLQRRREKEVVQGAVEGFNSLARDDEPLLAGAWTEETGAAFRAAVAAFKAQKTVAGKAVAEREDLAVRLEAADCAEKESARSEFQLFFDSAPFGMFQIEADGRFVRVNLSFALMLGYESPANLSAEHEYLTEFCLNAEEGPVLLTILKEQPHSAHTVTFRQRRGVAVRFSLIGEHSLDPDRPLQLCGFMLDRSLDEELEAQQRERDRAKEERSSLALLLAATCRQSQTYFVPVQDGRRLPPAGSDNDTLVRTITTAVGTQNLQGTRVNADHGGAERRSGINSLKAVFDDIYRIAVTEADGHAQVAAPIDLCRLMDRLSRQALPAMNARGTALYMNVAPDIETRVSGAAALLRHALLRMLLTVTGPVEGGKAYLSVVRDPNAPRIAGASRFIFSASWASGTFIGEPAPASSPAAAPSSAGEASAPEKTNPSVAEPGSNLFTGSDLSMNEELAVIRFLVHKMHGELPDGMFSRDSRSMQFIVQFEHLASGAEEASAAEAAEDTDPMTGLPRQALMEAAARAEAPRVFNSETPEDDQAAGSLDLLVVDDIPAGGTDADAPDEEQDQDGLDILLVDDSLNNRLLFSLFLRDSKHRITEAHNGQEGVEAFQRKKFDVIFMDMEMPLMDGYQATRIIRALEVDKGIAPTPIVAQTAHSLPEFKHQSMLAGCTEFLSKPFSKSALVTMLDAFMQLKRAPQSEN